MRMSSEDLMKVWALVKSLRTAQLEVFVRLATEELAERKPRKPRGSEYVVHPEPKL